MRYRKKPVVIEAFHYDGGSESLVALYAWCPDVYDSGPEGEVYISTMEGDLRANPGDWIIKGVKGEFYPCKPDVFEQTYEPVESSDDR